MKSTVFWNVAAYSLVDFWRKMLPASSESKVKSSKKPALLAACMLLVSWLAFSSALKMNTLFSSETLLDFYQTTWLYILEDITLHICSENFKSITTFKPLWTINIFHSWFCDDPYSQKLLMCLRLCLVVQVRKYTVWKRLTWFNETWFGVWTDTCYFTALTVTKQQCSELQLR